jgi:ketosteroid isomerase-like protein
MSQSDVDVVMQVLSTVETRDIRRLAQLYHPEIEFHWQPGLPYSGAFHGPPAVADMTARFAGVWGPLQPDAECQRLHPQVLATDGIGRVIVQYLWQAVDRNGNRFQTDTLADYTVRDKKLARAKMYYFDLEGMLSFLRSAGSI